MAYIWRSQTLFSRPGDADAAAADSTIDRLILVARRVEEVERAEIPDDLPVDGLMSLAQEGSSFAYLADPREDIYTINDLKVRFR